MKSSNNSSERKPPWPFKRPPNKCGVFCIVLGILFLSNAMLSTFFRIPLSNFLDSMVKKQISLTKSSMMTSLWSDPPVTPKFEIYVFNVTNANEFLKGDSKKIEVQEVGPYVYQAPQKKKILEFSSDENEITFQSKVEYKFLPEESGAGLDDQLDKIIVPNLIMMTGMMKTEVKPMPDFVKKSIIWPILTSTGYKTPFIKLSVAEFIWGYEDELACLDSNPGEESEYYDEEEYNDPFSAFEDFEETKSENEGEDKIESKSASKKPNFRRPDGKCVFGALVERNGNWDPPIKMLTGNSGLQDKGRILEISGSSNFNVWNKNSFCDRVSDSFEPSALPPTETLDKFNMYMGIMKRKVQMEHIADKTYPQGIETKRFVMSKDTFDFNSSGINQCYGLDSDLPKGIMSVAKFQEGSPMAVSFPHFLNADKWYLNQIHGVSDPDPKVHESYLDVEPHLGALIGAQARFQANLILTPDPAFPPLANLTGTTVLPIFWLQEGYDQLPSAQLQKAKLALMLPDLLTYGAIVLSVVLGIILVIVPIFKCARGILAEKRLQKKFKILHKKTHYVVSNKPATMYNAVPTTDSKNVDEEENL